jgi:hypothetical protein
MSNIPEARQLLTDALPGMPSPWREQVEAALTMMTRRSPARRRAAPKSAFVDARLAAEIRRYVARNPDETLQDVAVRFGTNIGRVSEALHGER